VLTASVSRPPAAPTQPLLEPPQHPASLSKGASSHLNAGRPSMPRGAPAGMPRASALGAPIIAPARARGSARGAPQSLRHATALARGVPPGSRRHAPGFSPGCTHHCSSTRPGFSPAHHHRSGMPTALARGAPASLRHAGFSPGAPPSARPRPGAAGPRRSLLVLAQSGQTATATLPAPRYSSRKAHCYDRCRAYR
jgi:hypothetical protein